MRTLHSYFGRELLKTFLMTAAALTLLIVMGGGVANIFRAEGIGAEQMVNIFIYLTPVAITLILPVAALFSATITYGRAAADNEILACQAAGINVHRLLLPPFILGLFISLVTYFSWNYVIPMLTARIQEVTRADLPAIVVGQFAKNKPLVFQKFRISAKQCERVPVSELPPEYREGHTFLRLLSVAFMEVEDIEYTRIGTADSAIIDFDTTEASPKVTAEMNGVRVFDAVHKQLYELSSQRIGPKEFPFAIARKIKFEKLDTLRAWIKDPSQIPEIIDLSHGLETEMMVYFLNQVLVEGLEQRENPGFLLNGRGFQIHLTAEQYLIDDKDGRLRLRGVSARVIDAKREKPDDIYRASDAAVELRTGFTTNRPTIVIELVGDVTISRDPAGPDDQVVKKPKETLPRVEFRHQPEMVKRYDAFDLTTMYAEKPPIALPQKQERMQGKVAGAVKKYVSEIQGEIQFRASYSLGATAIILIGAMLGIIVRNGQVLTAFGLSCVPMVIVIVASIVGRNLADKPQFEPISLATMWGATAFMYTAAVVVGFKWLKR